MIAGDRAPKRPRFRVQVALCVHAFDLYEHHLPVELLQRQGISADNDFIMDEHIINARMLTGSGPLWMLLEALRDNAAAVQARLIISSETTALDAVEVLRACGWSASLDPIGGDFHVRCRRAEGDKRELEQWLQSAAAGRLGDGTDVDEENLPGSNTSAT